MERVMECLALDVIIPVRDRRTVVDCVATLRAQASQAKSFVLRRILLCDGGSREADCQGQLAKVGQWDEVEVLHCGSENKAEAFNKGWLLNQGLAAATAPLTLISDVDILWNIESLEALATAAINAPQQITYIQSVVESEPRHEVLQRPRYAYRIDAQGGGFRVEVYAAAPSVSMRPGCGLVCARRSLFYSIGGYGHGFCGWGWEDQDLLMRAQLRDYALGQLGWVTHLSHQDRLRNNPGQGLAPEESRDANIRRCLTGLLQGRLLGDLSGTSIEISLGPTPSISVVAPPELFEPLA